MEILTENAIIKSIAVIVRKKNQKDYEFCIEAINELKTPRYCQLNVLTIEGERSAASARSLGMQSCKADIKIYIEDSVWLLDDSLLERIVDAFYSDKKLELIGLVGANEIPVSGVVQDSWAILGDYSTVEGSVHGKPLEEITEVMSVCGGFMALRRDYDWQDDVYFGDTFYDTALSLEVKYRGGRVALIPQTVPAIWKHFRISDLCIEGQDVFLHKYSKDIYPLVSIIIPTYCRPNYLRLALDSALAQTYRNIEIFITDNSPDNRTEDMINRIYRDERIIYEHHPELCSAAENWSVARRYDNKEAEYVQWLMDDDILEPEKIAAMVDCYRAHANVTLVTSYRRLIDANGNVLHDSVVNAPITDKDTVFSGDEIGSNMLKNMFNFIGEPTTVLIRKKYLLNNDLGWTGLEGECLASDFPTWLNLCSQGDVIYIRKPLSSFRLHDNNQQNKLEYCVLGMICWSMMIINALKKRIFLHGKKDIDQAVMTWLREAIRLLDIARDMNVDTSLDSKLRKQYVKMAKRLI